MDDATKRRVDALWAELGISLPGAPGANPERR